MLVLNRVMASVLEGVEPPDRSRPVVHPTRAAAIAVALFAVVASIAGAPTADAAHPQTILASPVSPVIVERLAALPRQPWLAGHRGIDLESAVGDQVMAPASGSVSFAGLVVDRQVVSIRHDNGLVTSLEPVSATVAVGERVVTGQAVGFVSDSPGHCAPAVCVHWGVRLHGNYVDPLDYLEGFGPIRLLPST